MGVINAFTVDVEDYFQVSAFEKHIGRKWWDAHDARVVDSTRRILRLLERHDVRGTFFVLGWVAERFPNLVSEIDRAGHEVGSHSYWHRLIYNQTPDEFRADLCMSRDVLENIIGRPVTSYRAPSFSITPRSWWALEILAEEGFVTDSSIFPTCHDRYGMPNAPQEIHPIATPAGTIWEIPLTVAQIGRWNIPVGGGGYFRLYPWSFTRRLLGGINRRLDRPFVFYVHPWEVDPEQPRVPVASRLSRFRHYVNLSTTELKLDRLLRSFRFGRLCDVVEAATRPDPSKSLSPGVAKRQRDVAQRQHTPQA